MTAEVRKPPKFTELQRQTLVLCATGCTDKEIASVLGCSPRTIEHRMGIIRHKVGVETRVEAAVWAAKQGLV
jgi:DNA-binding CsgD family transcriptional regulator